MSPHAVFALLLALVGVLLIVGVVYLECSELRERDRRRDEWRQLDRARDVTGRVR